MESRAQVPTVHRIARRTSVVLGAVLLTLTAMVGLAGSASAVTQSQAEAAFSAAGITWSSTGGCTTQSNPHCTSFSGLRSDTVNGAVTLRQASGCPINITGGTEVGHSGGTKSHANGWKLDFALNSCLTSYVENTFTYSGERGDGPIYTSGAGNVYVLENASHWDVVFNSCGGC